MKISCKKTQRTLFNNARFASNFFERLKGLLGENFIAENEAVIFKNCKNIHTIGMKFAIDILFLDENKRIIKIAPNVQPYQGRICLKAMYTIEIAANLSAKKNINIHDTLFFKEG